LGSNVSYNVKKITENGYLHQEWSSHDRRSVRVKLTENGLEQNCALETIFQRHSDEVVVNLGPEILAQINEILRGIEGFWLQQPGFGFHASEFSASRPPLKPIHTTKPHHTAWPCLRCLFLGEYVFSGLNLGSAVRRGSTRAA
jgi:hypothetical protein